ncbi:chromatin structure-remodeling complex protein SYD [Iris pallida]|uniref:Chromatin structure-remodeling complex protein SYD n=1 Tax=Iris pallida TaxID=29817 RepID=A0AAX6HFT8_IRIPA|nr:chromatin structure-remodeling complex protein SYD [Iris pallida]
MGEAYASGPILREQASGFLLTVVNFINSCAVEQKRLTPDKCMYHVNLLHPLHIPFSGSLYLYVFLWLYLHKQLCIHSISCVALL